MNMLSAKNVSKAAMMCEYETIIRPTVLYASKIWPMTKQDEQKLDI